MKLRNRKLLWDLLSESLITEQKEEKKEEEKKEKPKGKIDLNKYKESAYEGQTSNRLALGRPKSIGRELKEKSTDPAGATEIFKTLGIGGVTGANVYEQVMNLMVAAAKHADMGQVISSAEIVVDSKEGPVKIGTLIDLSGGVPQKESFYYVRELWRAAKTMGQLSGVKNTGSARLEVTDSNSLLFYHGKSMSWKENQGELE